MSRDRKLVVALFGVVVVLLSLSLGRAMGQGQPDTHGAPVAPVVPVAMSVQQIHFCTYRVFRMWSDGSVNTTLVKFLCNSNQPLCDLSNTPPLHGGSAR